MSPQADLLLTTEWCKSVLEKAVLKQLLQFSSEQQSGDKASLTLRD